MGDKAHIVGAVAFFLEARDRLNCGASDNLSVFVEYCDLEKDGAGVFFCSGELQSTRERFTSNIYSAHDMYLMCLSFAVIVLCWVIFFNVCVVLLWWDHSASRGNSKITGGNLGCVAVTIQIAVGHQRFCSVVGPKRNVSQVWCFPCSEIQHG